MGKKKGLDFSVCKIWGIPYFNDKASYPVNLESLVLKHFREYLDVGFCTLGQIEDWAWRWEFLRRTPAYRSYWEKYKKYGYHYYHPDFNFQGILPDPRKKFYEDIPSEFYRLFRNKKSRFHLFDELTAPKNGLLTLRVDLKLPLQKQFDLLKEEAQRKQKIHLKRIGISQKSLNTRIYSKEKWHKILRALDAREAGATFEEIGKIKKGQAGLASEGRKLFLSAQENQRLITNLKNIDSTKGHPVSSLDG